MDSIIPLLVPGLEGPIGLVLLGLVAIGLVVLIARVVLNIAWRLVKIATVAIAILWGLVVLVPQLGL